MLNSIVSIIYEEIKDAPIRVFFNCSAISMLLISEIFKVTKKLYLRYIHKNNSMDQRNEETKVCYPDVPEFELTSVEALHELKLETDKIKEINKINKKAKKRFDKKANITKKLHRAKLDGKNEILVKKSETIDSDFRYELRRKYKVKKVKSNSTLGQKLKKAFCMGDTSEALYLIGFGLDKASDFVNTLNGNMV